MKIIDRISVPPWPVGAWRQRRTRHLSLLLGVVLTAALLASAASASTSSSPQKPVEPPKFGECMRHHGAPNWANGHVTKKVKAATKACEKYLPGGHSGPHRARPAPSDLS
jgi:hypothetical protein